MMFLTELRPMNMNMNWTAPMTPNTPAAKAALKAMAHQAAQAQAAQTQTAAFQPRVSLCETPEAYLIQMELPGVAPESLELVLVNDELTVRGEKRPEALDGQWHVNERGFGPFERAFRFPTHVTQEGVQAETVHGILAIRVAKAKEAVPRKIQVISR
jgi:HSP20 family protein